MLQWQWLVVMAHTFHPKLFADGFYFSFQMFVIYKRDAGTEIQWVSGRPGKDVGVKDRGASHNCPDEGALGSQGLAVRPADFLQDMCDILGFGHIVIPCGLVKAVRPTLGMFTVLKYFQRKSYSNNYCLHC